MTLDNVRPITDTENFFPERFLLCGRHIATPVRPSRPATRGVRAASAEKLKPPAIFKHTMGRTPDAARFPAGMGSQYTTRVVVRRKLPATLHTFLLRE